MTHTIPFAIEVNEGGTIRMVQFGQNGVIPVGRSASQNQIKIGSQHVSRVHGVFIYRSGKVYFKHLSSTSNSFLSGRPIFINVDIELTTNQTITLPDKTTMTVVKFGEIQSNQSPSNTTAFTLTEAPTRHFARVFVFGFDIVGSTTLTRKVGDKYYSNTLHAPLFKLSIGLVRKLGGGYIFTKGDELALALHQKPSEDETQLYNDGMRVAKEIEKFSRQLRERCEHWNGLRYAGCIGDETLLGDDFSLLEGSKLVVRLNKCLKMATVSSMTLDQPLRVIRII